MGVWADVNPIEPTTNTSNPVYYKIGSNRGGFLTYNGSSTNVTHEDLSYDALWYFMTSSDGFYMIPAADPTKKLATHSSATTEGATWYIGENPYNNGYYCISHTNNFTSNCLDANNTNSGVGYWQPNATDFNGTSWDIVKVETTELSSLMSQQMIPSVPANSVISLSQAATSVTATTSANDNNHWYIVTQNRGGESPIYDTGLETQIKRAAASVTPSSLESKSAADNLQYLVRFISTGETDMYYIQFANGDFIDNNLYSARYKEKASFAFYPTTQGGNVFGWNLNSKEEERVDNNGAGSTVAFWESGINAETSGNNVWTIYPVTLKNGVHVIYELFIDGSKVNSVEVEAETNSTVNYPDDLFSNSGYSPLCYDLSHEGTIGTSDCTIKVTGTLKNGVVTALTGLSNDKSYTLTTQRGALYIKSDHLASNYKANANETPGKFAVIEYNNKYYLYSTDMSKFVQADGSLSEEMTSDVVEVIPTLQENNKYLFLMKLGTNGLNVTDTNDDYELVINNWVTPDAGNQYAIIEAGDFDATATLEKLEAFFATTYRFIISDASGVVYTSDYYAGETGSVITEMSPNIQFAFCSYTVTPTTLVNGQNDVLATVTYNMPFTPSTDFATATWYNLHGHATYSNYFVHTNGDATVWSTDFDGDADAYKWAFIGNPIQGIKVINKGAGDGKFLMASETATTMGTTATVWTLKQQSNTTWQSGEKGFGLYDETRTYANCAGGTVKYWQSFDQGSTFWVVTAEEIYNNLIAQLEAYPYGKGLNEYSLIVENNDYTTQAATIISSMKTAGYTAKNLQNAQLMLQGTSINLPATNAFYRIKGYSNNYVTFNNDNSNASMNGTAGVSNIVYYSAGKNIIFYNGGYGLYNTSIVAPVGSTLNEYTFSEGAQIGHYYIRSNYTDGGQYCYDNTTKGTKLDRYGSPVTSDSYQTDWTLEEVTELPITLNSAGDGYYATLYLPVDATITGADAYTIQVNDAKNAANTTQLDGGMVPANTAVLLKGTGSSGSASATVNTNDTFESTTSDLSGTLVAVNANGRTDYFLGKNTENQVGFYHWSGTVLKGFRAYLPAGEENGTGAKGFTLVFDEATGINTIENGKWTIENENVYNLQGQKVNRTQKGVYIVNGKKVVMK